MNTVLEGKKGKYVINEEGIDYPYSMSKIDKFLFKVSSAVSETDPNKRFIIKRLLFPTRLMSEISKFVIEISKYSGRKDVVSVLKLVDYVEKDNQIYLIQEDWEKNRMNYNTQIKEINIVNVIKQVVSIYNDFPNVILKHLNNSELGVNDLEIHHLIYNPNDYSVYLDVLNFNFQTEDFSMIVEPELESTHVRCLGNLIIQLLFKKSKPKEVSLDQFFRKEAKENRVKITNVMKNLISSLLSKNPPTWEKLNSHPLLNPLEPDYEMWKNEFIVDENALIAEKKTDDEEKKFNELKNYLIGLDQFNDARIALMCSPSEVKESSVSMFFFLLLKSIALHENFLKQYEKMELNDIKKKTRFIKQTRIRLQELEKYYSLILKKEYDNYYKDHQNIWFLKMNEIEFKLESDKIEEWLVMLSKQIENDLENVFNYLEKRKSILAKERKNYLALIK